jgi:electron transport complex protein RnfG
VKDLPTAPAEAGSGSESVAPARSEVAPGKLVATLAIAGALAGLVIVLVFQWADPQIQAHRAAALRAAVLEVLSAPASYQSLYVTPEGLTDTAPAGTDTLTADRVFLGFDDTGAPVGYAVTGAEPGFQDFIHLIFGYDPDTRRLLGMKVLESKETPGLGDKIFKDMDFVTGFQGVETPIVGVKQGAATGAENEVDMITGATISSRTVIGIINHRVDALGAALRAHATTDPRAPASLNPDPAAPGDAEQPVAPGDAVEEGEAGS